MPQSANFAALASDGNRTAGWTVVDSGAGSWSVLGDSGECLPSVESFGSESCVAIDCLQHPKFVDLPFEQQVRQGRYSSASTHKVK